MAVGGHAAAQQLAQEHNAPFTPSQDQLSCQVHGEAWPLSADMLLRVTRQRNNPFFCCLCVIAQNAGLHFKQDEVADSRPAMAQHPAAEASSSFEALSAAWIVDPLQMCRPGQQA